MLINIVNMDKEHLEKTVHLVGQRIKQRAQTRQQIAEEKRATLQDRSSEIESADKFYNNFAKQKENISTSLNDNEEKNKYSLQFIRNNINQLQQDLNEASMYLPAFQIKKSQEAIDALSKDHSNIQNILFPKKKFGFKSKPTVNTVVPLSTNSSASSSHDTGIAALLESNFFGFKNKSNCTLSKNAADLNNKQLNLHNLDNCKVLAFGNPQSLQIANLTNCSVHVGPTTRSSFIKNCTGCTFLIACQQVRIHNTSDSHFFLHVTGSAIIEDCTTVTFSSYNLTYENIDEHYINSGLSREVNNWDKVEDFNWLNEDEKSPNFSLVAN